jgi:hypothetical protein
MAKNCCLKLRGMVYMAVESAYKAGTAGLVEIGNASSFELNADIEEESTTDFTSVSGGVDCAVRSINKVTLAIKINCAKAENLAKALSGAGATGNTPVVAVVDEPKILWLGAVQPLNKMMDRAIAPVVKNMAGSTTYVNGTDYEITKAGAIRKLPGGTIPEPVVTLGVGAPNIKVSYSSKAASAVQMLTNTGEDYVLYFDGANQADDSAIAQFFLYKVRVGPAKSVTVIGDKMTVLESDWSVLRDDSKPTGTLQVPQSQYGTFLLSA